MGDKERIAEEIEKLRGIEGRVRPTTMFGDSNVDAVVAQRVVLERDMNLSDIYTIYGQNGYVCEAALDAYYWGLDEQDGNAPSVGWEPLCREEETE